VIRNSMDASRKTPRKRAQQVVTTTTTERPFKRPRQASFARQIGAVASDSAPEKKNIDISTAITAAGATQWTLPTLINGIAQGATANNRVGRRLVIKSVLVRFALQPGAAALTVRWMLIYDHAPNGALPAITDILTIDAFTAPMNLINNDRFMVIHDEVLNGMVAATQIGGKFYRRFTPGMQNQWTNAATGTIADITTGAFYVLACSQVGSAVMTFTSRIRFTDL